MEEKVIVIKKFDQTAEDFKKHPTRSLLLYGFSSVAFGFVASLFVIGAFIGIPMMIIGSIMFVIGLVMGALNILVLLGKRMPTVPSKITDKTKRFGLLFPKRFRSKELQEKYS